MAVCQRTYRVLSMTNHPSTSYEITSEYFDSPVVKFEKDGLQKPNEHSL